MIEIVLLLSFLCGRLPEHAQAAWAQRRVLLMGIEPSIKPLPTAMAEGACPPLRREDYWLPLDRYVVADLNRNQRLYGERSVDLKPKYIALHFTVIPDAADVLAAFNRPTALGVGNQLPVTSLVSVHYMVDKDGTILALAPEGRRTSGTYGLDHRALSIEMVAADETDLLSRPKQLMVAFCLVDGLLKKYRLPVWNVVSHQDVAYGNVFLSDYTDIADTEFPYFYPKPSFRYDPGHTVMAWCREFLLRRRGLWGLHPRSKVAPAKKASSKES